MFTHSTQDVLYVSCATQNQKLFLGELTFPSVVSPQASVKSCVKTDAIDYVPFYQQSIEKLLASYA